MQTAYNALTNIENGEIAYQEAYDIIDTYSESILKTFLFTELESRGKFFMVKESSFNDKNGVALVDSANIDSSILYNFRLYNKLGEAVSANVIMGVYYDGKLKDTRILPVNNIANGDLTESYSIGYDGIENVLPDFTGYTKKEVKIFIWNNDNLLESLTDSVEMYNGSERKVRKNLMDGIFAKSLIIKKKLHKKMKILYSLTDLILFRTRVNILQI